MAHHRRCDKRRHRARMDRDVQRLVDLVDLLPRVSVGLERAMRRFVRSLSGISMLVHAWQDAIYAGIIEMVERSRNG